MSNYLGKQPSSRPILTTAMTSATAALKATAQTYQLRVIATTVAAVSVTDSSATPLSSLASPNVAANQVGEYFTISPGQWYFAYGSAQVTEMT